ncbi:MAG: DEAD/DEAH box helicase [Synergistaceae bacterium]|nr:DEAD/DEAH box helicase [Synergistaceae bacterium]
MLALHCAFSGGLFLWGERSFVRSGLKGIRGRPRAGNGSPAAHLWDAGADNIVQALGDLGFRYDRPLPADKAEIFLPTYAGKCPVPSSALLGEIPPAYARGNAPLGIKGWLIEPLPVGAGDLFSLAPLFSRAGAPTPEGRLLAPGVMMALDLCFVAECWRFARSLLERGRFLPDIKASRGRGGEEAYESVWRPLLAGDDAERFARLARLMPPILRFRCDELKPEGRDSALYGIFSAMIDGFVRWSWNKKRRIAQEDVGACHSRLARVIARGNEAGGCATPALKRKGGRLVSAKNPHLLWVSSLGWLNRTCGITSPLESIYRDVREWWGSFEWFAHAPFKLCLELKDPDAGGWRLDYVMKFPETGEMIPMEDVWRGKWRPSGRGGRDCVRRFALLTLGRIGAVAPPVRRSLEEYAPTGCGLSQGEAADFLLTLARALKSDGVGVCFPEWWRRASSEKLTLRGRVTGGVVPASFFRDLVDGVRSPGDDVRVALKWEMALGGSLLSPEDAELVRSKRTPLMFIQGRWAFVRPEGVDRICARAAALPESLPAVGALRLAVCDASVDGFLDSPELEAAYEALAGGLPVELAHKPVRMRGELRPYQSRGVSWMSFLSGLGLGACLADDMGLGKTVQALAMIQHHRDLGEHRPVLLICPTSVLENWRLEVSRFLPELSVYLHHGRNRPKGRDFAKEISGYAIVLSSYSVLQRDSALYGGIEWAGVVLDEAQNIKNPDTNQARAAHGINAAWRVALTGTPIENHVGDLWSIMEFLMPGLLGSKRHFNEEYVKPIQESMDTGLMDDLKRSVAPFVMRRMKTDRDIVPDLPRKIETKVFCGLKKEQAALYSEVTDGLGREIAGIGGIRRRGIVLAGLTKIKQICDHPSLALKDQNPSPERSAKLERMLALADEMFETDCKALVFTQYVEMGDILKLQLQDRFGKEAMFLHGAVQKDSRDRMVRRFQEAGGPQFFILSLRAGGVGLNLTGANHVVMYDRWWNPAVEQQAIDRAYRIGQSKNVQVHIFCCRGTLEERIDAIIESKKEVADMVIESSDNWITELSDRDLQELLSLSPGVLEA